MSTHSLDNLRHVLVVGSDIRRDAEVYRQLAPLQRSWDLELHRAPQPGEAVELVRSTSFDLLVVGHDLVEPSPAELVRAARAEGAACRHSAVLVIADAEDVERVRGLVGPGVNRVISLTASESEVRQVLSDLLNIAPRVHVAAPLRWGPRDHQPDEAVTGETDNLSISGMLVRGASAPGLGTRLDFEIDLPGLAEPVSGVAEVVRQATGGDGEVLGFAARFLAFHGIDRQRLEAFIIDRTDQP